jgi:hypothetical protein
MRFYSFLTADTEESIPVEDSGLLMSPVYLLQPNGKKPIKEICYEGRGVFGNVNCYEWLSIANGISIQVLMEQKLIRPQSHQLSYPLKFSFDENAIYEGLPRSKDCSYQGFWYPETLFLY